MLRFYRLLFTVFTAFISLWLLGVVLLSVAMVWILFFADPALMAPDSLSRNSPPGQKAFALAIMAFFFCFGVGWLLLLRYLWRRTRKRLGGQSPSDRHG